MSTIKTGTTVLLMPQGDDIVVAGCREAQILSVHTEGQGDWVRCTFKWINDRDANGDALLTIAWMHKRVYELNAVA